MDAEAKIAATWDEIGCRVRAVRRVLIVRTTPQPKKIGLLWIPETAQGLYQEKVPHLKIVSALVLSAGPKATVKAGETVCFQRLYFARWKVLEDKCFVGWIDESQIVGYPADDVVEDQQEAAA